MTVNAHPYASGLTNSAGTIKFILNEAASDVTVAFDNGSVTNDLGALASGAQSFSLAGHSNFSIIVSKTGSGAVSQISMDATNNSFFGPRGVAVNRNAKTRFFGRIYVANANAGILNGGATNQTTYRGIYVLNADTSDALGRGTNVSFAGIGASLGSSTTYAPFKCFVGPDDMVYVGDASGSTGSGSTAGEPVWMTDPDVTQSNKLFVNGSGATNNKAGPCASTPFVTGSLAAGNLALYCVMWNYSSPTGTFNNVFKYNIGAGPMPWSNAPTVLGNAGSNTLNGLEDDLYIAPDGKFFVSQNHGTAAGATATLRVFDTNGTTQLWDSKSANGGTEPLVDVLGIAVSPDDAFVAASTRAGNFLIARLTNGVPDLATLKTNSFGLLSTTRGVAFDAADNLYIVTGGLDRLRAYSLGLNSVATTSNDSTCTNGTFQFVGTTNQPPTITLQPTDLSVQANALVTFNVGVSGATPLTYQWKFNGTPLSDNAQITGSHSNVLALTGVGAENQGGYQAFVTNSYGFATSRVAVLTVVTSVAAVWTQFPNTPGPNNVRHDDIYFTDPTNGWASQNHYIYRTINGGATWTTNLFLSGTHFRSVAFATPMVGFAGNLGPGSYDSNITDTNILYRSYDGGVSWAPVPGFWEAGMRGLCVIDVLDSRHIYGAGRVRGTNAFFIKSSDGGTNWSIFNLSAMGIVNGIMDVYFHDTNNGWVVGMDTNSFYTPPYYGRIARTTNGGTNWTTVVTTSAVSNCYFWKMSWPTTNIGYCALQQNGSYNTVVFYKTIDGGNNWVSNGIPLSSIGSPSSFYQQGLGFVSPNEGWMGGASGIPFLNSFIHTTDGGVTWTPMGYDDTYFINRIRFLSPTLGYASGGNLHIYTPPLAITAQPQGQVVVAGTNVNLLVGAVGVPPLSYQWKKNSADQSGATQPNYTLSNVARVDAGTYSVVVSNLTGSLLSSNAIVRVLVPERLAAPVQLPGGGLQLLFADADGGALLTTNDIATFTVEASTNLVNWFAISNVLSVTNGMMLFQDTTTNYPARFYRVLEH
jgi:hypothetical protein